MRVVSMAALCWGLVACGGASTPAGQGAVPASGAAPAPAPQPGRGAPRAPLDADAIGRAAGTPATEAEGVVRIGWLRSQVAVTIDRGAFPAAAGLGSWAAFAPAEGGAMVMGDTVVFEDEINPAIDAAFAHGLHITALHNHFIHDDPPVYFMHIGGRGAPEDLATGVKAVWDAIKAVRAAHPQPRRAFPGPVVKPGTLDASTLSSILDRELQEKPGGVLKAVFPRQARMGDLAFGGSMGLTTWAAFAGDRKLASIDGDFAMTANEVQPVLRAMRAANLNIAALHNHMIGEEPAYYFVHYWGKGPAEELARGFRAVLDAQAAAN